jgi:RNA polymerase primary sigma factor
MKNATKTPQTTVAAQGPAVPSAGPIRADASLARYMSELASYELLSRADEIALAKDVERLEVTYWSALLSLPVLVPVFRPLLVSKVEPVPSEVASWVRAAGKMHGVRSTRTERARYERAASALAARMRELDIHRDIVKEAHGLALAYCGVGHEELALGVPRPTRPTKAMQRYVLDIEAARREQQAAKDRFVAANLRLVVSMARRYARSERMPLSDLIQEGNLGLMKAVERFDHSRGFRFSTYASWWIRHALTRGLADKGRIVRLPVHALEARARVARVTRKLKSKNGVAPNLAEIAEETGLPIEKVVAAEQLSVESHYSLDATVGNDTERTFVEMLQYEDEQDAEQQIVTDSNKESLSALLGELTPFEAQILRYRYGFDGGEERTLKEIGDMYNLSRERIRQIQALALAKMRSRIEDEDRALAAS